MTDGRDTRAGERAEGPALAAGLSASAPAGLAAGRRRTIAAWLTRPEMEGAALRSYRRERRTNLGIPVVSALMEGGFVGVIADKIYHVHPAVLALISAAPMFGLLSSFVWARLARGRPKVPWITSLMALFTGAAAVVAALPEGRLGSWLLVTAMISARLLLGGIITIRSLVWTLNYRREARARVTSRLQFINILVMTATSLAGAALLDAEPASFRVVYGIGALLGTLGTLSFSRVRVVGEREHLSLEQLQAAEAERAQVALNSAWGVLRADPMFRRYQTCQFLLGVCNMMIEAPLIYLVSHQLQASYTTSIALTLALPLGLSLLTLPLWAVYFDRVHIAEFRARHSWIFVAAQMLTWIGALCGSLLWIGAGRAALGVGRGGGDLAWQLGHNDFARPENVGLYMGIHVTLTGIRGAFAPFVGMLLYVGWGAAQLPVLGLRVPAFDGLGAQAIGVACLLGVIGALGYWALHRQMADRG